MFLTAEDATKDAKEKSEISASSASSAVKFPADGFGLVTDTLSPNERSKRMSLIRNRDTKPELAVRRLVHSLGFRYRLHRSDLPGKPDLVFSKRRKVVFVHGCFWHRHAGCSMARLPKSRLDFWVPKLEKNRERDEKHQAELRRAGWRILVIWECELRDLEALKARIIDFLNGGGDGIG